MGSPVSVYFLESVDPSDWLTREQCEPFMRYLVANCEATSEERSLLGRLDAPAGFEALSAGERSLLGDVLYEYFGNYLDHAYLAQGVDAPLELAANGPDVRNFEAATQSARRAGSITARCWQYLFNREFALGLRVPATGYWTAAEVADIAIELKSADIGDAAISTVAEASQRAAALGCGLLFTH